MSSQDDNNLIGHEQAENIFFNAFKNNRVHHAWLICGDKGIGKATLAYKIAKFMLSNHSHANCTDLNIDPNSQTVLKINNRSHPDLFVLESEKEKDGNPVKEGIKVDEVRELTKFLSLTSVLSKNKIVIIDSINDLNHNAANALLKFLEEPFANTYYLLVCHSLNAILPTLKSRCRLLRLKKIKFEDFYKILKLKHSIDPSEAQNLYELNNGSLYYTGMLLHPKISELFKIIETCLSKKIPLRELLKISKGLSNDFEFQAFKYMITKLLHKKIKENKNLNTLEMEFKKLENIQELLYSCEKFNLDRTYVIQNALNLLQP